MSTDVSYFDPTVIGLIWVLVHQVREPVILWLWSSVSYWPGKPQNVGRRNPLRAPFSPAYYSNPWILSTITYPITLGTVPVCRSLNQKHNKQHTDLNWTKQDISDLENSDLPFLSSIPWPKLSSSSPQVATGIQRPDFSLSMVGTHNVDIYHVFSFRRYLQSRKTSSPHDAASSCSV